MPTTVLLVVSPTTLLVLQYLLRQGPARGGDVVWEAQATQASYSHEKVVPMTGARAELSRHNVPLAKRHRLAKAEVWEGWSDLICPFPFVCPLPLVNLGNRKLMPAFPGLTSSL